MDNSITNYDYVPFRGIAISGAEAGSEYTYALTGMPSTAVDMAYYVEHGMNTARFPIKWSYIVENSTDSSPSLTGEIYLDAMYNSLEDMLDNGLNVILDLHSYMRFSPGNYAGSGQVIATEQEVYNIWSIISNKIKDLADQYPETLILELWNEPYSMNTMDVLDNHNASIAAVRDAGLTNMVVLDGNSWSGLHSWHKVGSATDGLSNAEVFTPANIIDPLNNYAIAVHQYVDWNGSGTSPIGQAPSDFQNYLHFEEFMAYVHEHDLKIFLGEFGSGDDPNAMTNVNYLLDQVHANPYVEGEGGFIGWAAWVGGHTWAQHNFNYIGPEADGSPNAQMANVFIPHLVPIDGDFVVPDPTPDPDPVVDPDPTPDPTPEPDPDPVLSGSHVFDWDWGARDVVSNFDVNNDAIDLSKFWTSYDNIEIADDGQGNLSINLLDVDNHLITITGVTLASFSAVNLIGVAGQYVNGVSNEPVKYYSFDWNYGLATTIDDFDVDTGVIELNSFSGRTFSELEIYNNANGDAVINLAFNSQPITLLGVSADELTADNFYAVTGDIADALVGDVTPPVEEPDPVVDPEPEPTPDPEPEPDPIPDPEPDPDPVLDPGGDVDEGGDGNNEPPSVLHAFTYNWGGRTEIAFDANTDGIDLSSFWISYDQMSIHEDSQGNVVIDLLDLNNQTITLLDTSLDELADRNIVGVTGSYDNAVVNDAAQYYHYSWNYGADTVIDGFNVDVGVIELGEFNQSIDNVHVSNNENGDAVVDLGFDNQTITLTGVSAEEVTNDNFLM